MMELLRMTKKVSQVDRRAFERFDVIRESDLNVPPHCPGFGSIIDISMGGLAFEANLGGHREDALTHVDIFFSNNICCLKNIPCRVFTGQNSPRDPRATVGRIQFGDLSQKQKNQLQYLIKIATKPKKHIPS